MTPVVVLDGVRRAFQRRRGLRASEVVAVDGVSLEVGEAEIVAIVGQSGAGKSTLARLVLGLERPDAGAVRFEGIDLARLSRRELRTCRQRMHLVLQDPYQSLHPGMRVSSLVGEPLSVRGAKAQERAVAVAEALAQVSLVPAEAFATRYPHQLSGGQRQRVALARAIVAHPRLIVADEPTSMLDASLCAEILQLVLGIRDRLGTAIVFITHDLAVAHWVADRMIVMRDGRIVESGPSADVVSDPKHEYTKLLIDASEGRLDRVRAGTRT